MKKRLITAALPYVNNVPHLGNIIQVLSADCFARFCRLRGYETLYVCGTDEYGTATETKAAQEGVAPRALCDRFWAVHDAIYRWFDIDFDVFGRTSTPVHAEITRDVFTRLHKNGFIREKESSQLYCERCGRFLADRYVRGVCPGCGYDGARGDQCERCGKLLDPVDLREPRCAVCAAAPVLKTTRHLYLDLPALRERLEAWVGKAKEAGNWARNAVSMTQSWIRDGLRERAITRDLRWGIPVPLAGYEHKVFYVWFDAPIGYVSILAGLADERGAGRAAFVADWWKNPENVDLFQFIGKDNIPFHTVVFPCSQLGSGENWTMLRHMSSTEYLNYESGKFSKSRGVGVFGTDAMETGIDACVWRFYLFYNRPEKADALFTWKDFGEKVNAELIGNLANLVNRTLSFVLRYYGGAVPRAAPDAAFWDAIRAFEKSIGDRLERAELRDAFRLVFEMSSFANKAFQDGEPWKTRICAPEAAAALIAGLCYAVRDLAVLCYPYIPRTAGRIAAFFGKTIRGRNSPGGPDELRWDTLGSTDGLDRVFSCEILFRKLEEADMRRLRERYAGAQRGGADEAGGAGGEPDAPRKDAGKEGGARPGAAPGAPPDAAPDEPAAARFTRLIDLRTAVITAVEKHPKADKLYIETLDIAGETRTIVSGLVPYYAPEELLGRHVVVAYNLKEARLRGVPSRGMLLAATALNGGGAKETVEALDPGAAPPGSRVLPAGFAPPEGALPEIDIDTFLSVPLAVKDGVVRAGDTPLHVNGVPLRARAVLDGTVG